MHHAPHKPREVAAIEPGLRAALRELVAGRGRWPLVLTGPPGTGKTCAALCLLDHAGGLYFTAAGLAEEVIRASKGQLKAHNTGNTLGTGGLWREIGRAALVVIDELGARERISDWQYEQVKRVLDDREGRPTVCVSNQGLAALGRLYDDRLASRLAAGTVIELAGSDRRLQRGA